MKSKTLTLITSLWLGAIGATVADDDKHDEKDFRGGGSQLVRRITALESIVARQSDQISLLRKALDREIAARKAADAALQSRVDKVQQSTFTSEQVETLQGIASVATVEHTNIYVGGNICVGGNVAVRDGQTLFVSHIRPSDGDCGGNAAGVTIFDGNVGIRATNTLFVNNLRAFEAIPPSPMELQSLSIGLGETLTLTGGGGISTVIINGPLLFRIFR